jgi:hypothetical protein
VPTRLTLLWKLPLLTKSITNPQTMELYIILYLEHYTDLYIAITSLSVPNQKLIHGDTITNAIYQILNTTKNSKVGNWPLLGPKLGVPLYTPFFNHAIITFTNTLNNYPYTGCSFLPVLYLGHTVPIPITDHPSRATNHYGGNGQPIPPYIYRVFIFTHCRSPI